MTQPYVYTDPEGDFLTVGPCKLGIHVSVRPAGSGMGSFAACVRPEDVRTLTAEMRAAAGMPSRWTSLRERIADEITASRSRAAVYDADDLHDEAHFRDGEAEAYRAVLRYMDEIEAGR